MLTCVMNTCLFSDTPKIHQGKWSLLWKCSLNILHIYSSNVSSKGWSLAWPWCVSQWKKWDTVLCGALTLPHSSRRKILSCLPSSYLLKATCRVWCKLCDRCNVIKHADSNLIVGWTFIVMFQTRFTVSSCFSPRHLELIWCLLS
jgi:hypothetical protein